MIVTRSKILYTYSFMDHSMVYIHIIHELFTNDLDLDPFVLLKFLQRESFKISDHRSLLRYGLVKRRETLG